MLSSEMGIDYRFCKFDPQRAASVALDFLTHVIDSKGLKKSLTKVFTTVYTHFMGFLTSEVY